MNGTNHWDASDSEEDNDNDYQNETVPPDIDTGFRDNILKIKHSLYDNIVLAPDIETPQSQSKDVLQTYLNRLNDVYILSMNAQNGQIEFNDDTLRVFPENSREAIKTTLGWIHDYFSKNRAPDTIPYKDYIKTSFHTYPFVQKFPYE